MDAILIVGRKAKKKTPSPPQRQSRGSRMGTVPIMQHPPGPGLIGHARHAAAHQALMHSLNSLQHGRPPPPPVTAHPLTGHA